MGRSGTAENRRRACGGACHSADAGAFFGTAGDGKEGPSRHLCFGAGRYLFCRQPTGAGVLFCHCRRGGCADARHQLSGAEGRGASAGAWESRDSLQRGNAFDPASGRGRSGRACVPAKPPDRRISAADGICVFSASCRKAGGDWRRCGCRCVSGASSSVFRRC